MPRQQKQGCSSTTNGDCRPTLQQQLRDMVRLLWRFLWRYLDVQQDIENVPDYWLCVICKNREINCVLLDCAHMVTCTMCAELGIPSCPVCCEPVKKVVLAHRTNERVLVLWGTLWRTSLIVKHLGLMSCPQGHTNMRFHHS